MRVTGYEMMDRLEELKELAKTLDAQFTSSQFRFEDEEGEKPDPRRLLREYEAVEDRITRIQEAQAAYNLQVQVEVLGERMTLHRALRLGSVAGRVKNHWKTAAGDSKMNPYGLFGTITRDKEQEYAKRAVPAEECLLLADQASKRAAACKRAIRAGNATALEVDLDPSVF